MSVIPIVITKTVTIVPGESFTLPSNATIVSVSDVLDTECDLNLPDPESFVNYTFKFALNQDNNDNHPMGSEVNIASILIDTLEIPLSFTALNTHSLNNPVGVNIWSSQRVDNNITLNTHPLEIISILWDNHDIYGGTDKHDVVTVTIKMLESYQNKVLLKITNNKFPNDIYLKGKL